MLSQLSLIPFHQPVSCDKLLPVVTTCDQNFVASLQTSETGGGNDNTAAAAAASESSSDGGERGGDLRTRLEETLGPEEVAAAMKTRRWSTSKTGYC